MKFILFFFILPIGFGAAFIREPFGYKTIVKNVNCTFSVGKKNYISGPCKYTYYETPTMRGFQLEQKRPKNYFSYFVVVHLAYGGRGNEMLWNGPNIKAMHAEEDLGYVKKRGQCWFNNKARLCLVK